LSDVAFVGVGWVVGGGTGDGLDVMFLLHVTVSKKFAAGACGATVSQSVSVWVPGARLNTVWLKVTKFAW
jgi:hypothetical protein